MSQSNRDGWPYEVAGYPTGIDVMTGLGYGPPIPSKSVGRYDGAAADAAQSALAGYERTVVHGPKQDVLRHFLADLMHLAARENVDFDLALESARTDFEIEQELGD